MREGMRFHTKSQYILKRLLHLSSICNKSGLENRVWIEPSGYKTGLSVYNFITKTKVPLILKNPSFAGWYMCGPTVYDSAHLGHACSYVKFDIIRRILLNYFNVNIVMVMGITDIDDKIIVRAAQLKEDYHTLTHRYEREFFSDMATLNVLPPTITVRVTDVVPDIIRFIQKIIDKGQAYTTDDGSVYFDASSYEQYEKLHTAAIDEYTSEMSDKRSAIDFALWKGAKPGEPWWPSPWHPGKGRPGWHIECSTIASMMLGSNIDLHSGGIDLKFPHHQNEELQSCAHHAVDQWVNYWLHTGHLHVKGDVKMSKSLKNTISIQDFLGTCSANEFRIFCLLSGYRNGVEYSDLTLQNARDVCKKIKSFVEDSEAYIKGLNSQAPIDEPKLLEILSNTKDNFVNALADDFDTPKAFNALFELISVGNKMIHTVPQQDMEFARNPAAVAAVSSFVLQTMERLGASFASQQNLSQASDSVDLQGMLDKMVNFRNQVRETALENLRSKDHPVEDLVKQAKDANKRLLTCCDQFRNDLVSSGIQIKDFKGSSSWSIKNP